MPAIVRDLDDDTANNVMVNSNLQQENILPSKCVQAYRIKHDALRRQAGGKVKENPVQVGQNSEAKTLREILVENSPDSYTQIQCFIRLTELTPEFQEVVDSKKIALTPPWSGSSNSPRAES